MSNAANKMTAANVIADQIGNRAFVMMGAKNLLGGENHLQFKIGSNSKKVTHVTVTLTSDDLYTVRFDRVTKIGFSEKTGKTTGGVKVLAEVEAVSVDQLRATIEHHTGLYLSL
jgi:hypothetical protein